ncbi:3-deoxy-D-manno-octulosonic acid transferase [Lignipirellula cremea]|uniref:3-deoxy-D-manno-octulosonic acid transferase n=1 Tax=Lignipirellula cremea TaxID=2528010 RepID=A0A518DWF3_9BACT|nr:3-deoxy-D-manno-octulosonic acid transferase [Lignipirellula cremea]QDU96166.1 3-deoxy-D-manno-octulosonic acid transferase [Lignipirellula cremea]
MIAYLLNAVYLFVALAASPWLLYGAVFKGKYRQGWAQKLLGLAPDRRGQKRCLWLHAVSVGEVNLLGVMLKRLQQQFPGREIVISTTTQTGYDLAVKKYAAHRVFFCPLDFSWAVKTAVRRVQPEMLILAELELWPNLLRAAQRSDCRTVVINGRLSENSFRGYRRLGPLARLLFQRLDLVAAQSKDYADRFRSLGAPQVEVTGSLKFDGAQLNPENAQTQQLRQLAGYQNNQIVFLAGSTQRGEEALAIEVYQRLLPRFPELRLILVPRHPDRFDEVADLLENSSLDWRRRSTLEPAGKHAAPGVLLVDTIGELGGWWGVAKIAYVGGSLGSRGGQNMVEPAAYGAAVSFGPNTRNFRDIVKMMLQYDAAVVVRNADGLTRFVEHCLGDDCYRQQQGERAQQLVAAQQGAADATLRLLKPYALRANPSGAAADGGKTGKKAA